MASRSERRKRARARRQGHHPHALTIADSMLESRAADDAKRDAVSRACTVRMNARLWAWLSGWVEMTGKPMDALVLECLNDAMRKDPTRGGTRSLGKTVPRDQFDPGS